MLRNLCLTVAGALALVSLTEFAVRSRGVEACMPLDLGDIGICANRVAGWEPEAYGGTNIQVVIRGQSYWYTTERTPDEVAGALLAMARSS